MAVSEEKLSVNMGFLTEMVGLGHTDIVMYPLVDEGEGEGEL